MLTDYELAHAQSKIQRLEQSVEYYIQWLLENTDAPADARASVYNALIMTMDLLDDLRSKE